MVREIDPNNWLADPVEMWRRDRTSNGRVLVTDVRARVIRTLQVLGVYRIARRVFDATVWLTPGGRRSRRRMLQLYGTFVGPGDLCLTSEPMLASGQSCSSSSVLA